jgi:hypothetical protein
MWKLKVSRLWPLLGCPALVLGQSTTDLREILNRVEKLEQSNRDLTEQVRSLKQELAAVRGESAAAADTTQDVIAVEKARVEEMAQSKVEASEKFPIRVTGMALFNAYINGRNNGGVENPVIASLSPGDATGGGTLRQTTLGLQFDSPRTVLGSKVTGSIYADFFGGTASSLNHLVRLRTAIVSLDWTNTTVSFGQDKPIISPRDPVSLAQVGVSPLTAAGNLWLWQPQVRVEQRFQIGSSAGLKAQVGVFQTRELGDESNGYNYYAPPPAGVAPPLENARPGFEGRFMGWKQWGQNTRLEIAPGYHFNASTVGTSHVDSKVFTIDWLIRPVKYFDVTGFFYQGQNVANLGALPQGFVFVRGTGINAVHSTGGWVQIGLPVTERLSFHLYGGRQDDRNSDLKAGFIGLNEGFAANAMYRVAPNVIFSLEAGQTRTTYLGTGIRLNNHYDLAVAYLF